MNYYKNSERGDITWDDLKSFCLCLGGPSLSAILKRLCQTPAHRSGLPDIAGKFYLLSVETSFVLRGVPVRINFSLDPKFQSSILSF